MKNNLLTIDMLNDIKICAQGRKWFKKNYPDGLKITKENVAEAITKLHKVKEIFSLFGQRSRVVMSLKDMKKDRDLKYIDTDESRKMKQREDRFDNTVTNISFALDALYQAVGIGEGEIIFRTYDIWYEREDMSEDTDLSAIIKTVWQDIQEYRTYLISIKEG